jgi:hypothetical protein
MDNPKVIQYEQKLHIFEKTGCCFFIDLNVEVAMFIVGVITMDLNVNTNTEPGQTHLTIISLIICYTDSSKKLSRFVEI